MKINKMFNSTYRLFFAAFGLVCLNSACNKNKPEPPPTCEEDPSNCYNVEEVKDFLYFDYGSYWVYEEENSGMLDSVYVTETTHNPSTYYFSTKVYSAHNDYYYRYWPILGTGGSCPESGLVKNDIRCIHIKMSKGKPGDFVAENYVFFYKTKKGEFRYNPVVYCDNNMLTVIETWEETTINEVTFNDVFVIEENCTRYENKQHTKHYYSRHHGLIRKELIDSNQVWNLVRFELFQ